MAKARRGWMKGKTLTERPLPENMLNLTPELHAAFSRGDITRDQAEAKMRQRGGRTLSFEHFLAIESGELSPAKDKKGRPLATATL